MKRRHKLVISIVIILMVLTMTVVSAVNLSPYPISYISKKLVFDPSEQTLNATLDARLSKLITVANDLEYPSEMDYNTFDLYQPKETDKPSPVIIWVHGGGFVGGDKRMFKNYGAILAAEGYTVISMNYPLAPQANYPDPLFAVSAMVEYLTTEADTLKIDMSQVVMGGDSAGAQLISQYVLTQVSQSYGETMDVKSLLSKDDIKGVLLYCGIYQIEDLLNEELSPFGFVFDQLGWAYLGEKEWRESELLEQASIIGNMTKDFPPTYLTDGNFGSFEASAKALESKFKDLDIEYRSRFFDQGVILHEFQFNLDTKEARLVLNDTLMFLKRILN